MSKKNFSGTERQYHNLSYRRLPSGNRVIYINSCIQGTRKRHNTHLILEAGDSLPIQASNVAKEHKAIMMCHKMEREFKEGYAGLVSHSDSNILLTEWLDTYLKTQQGKSKSTCTIAKRSFELVRIFTGGKEVSLCNVDKDFLSDFFEFVRGTNNKKCRRATPLSPNTARQYCDYLGFALNKARKMGFLKENPFDNLDKTEKIRPIPVKRVYLDIEEVQHLIDTPCRHDAVKRAFLFACFCGLRLGDISALTWGNLKADENSTNVIRMQKTGTLLYFDLSPSALRWLPDRNGAEENERVFHLPSVSSVEYMLRQWCLEAGIRKHVTFHISRHTFATMLLTLGGDIYTVSKLLGHTKLQTTQIYADITNQKIRETVNLTNGVFKFN